MSVAITKLNALLTLGKMRVRSWVPYLSHVFSRMRTIATDKVPTMAVDKYNRLYVNESYAESLDRNELSYVLLHEVMHVVLSHCKRLLRLFPTPTERERYCWNVCCDLVIQQLLEQIAGVHEPKGIITPRSLLPDNSMRYLDVPGFRIGMSSEQYMGLLLDYMPEQPPKPDGNNPCDPANAGSNSDGIARDYEEPNTGVEQAMVEHALREAEKKIQEATGSIPGNVSESLRKSIEARLRPQPDPFDELRTVVGRCTQSSVGTDEYTYRMLSRRHPDSNPRRRGVVRLSPECSIIIDTSGSMSGTETKCFKAISDGLKRVHRPRVIAYDSCLQSAKRISSLEQFSFVGYGGTDMRAAIEQEDREHKPDAIVIVTDGETGWPTHQTRARLIVALVRRSSYGYSVPRWARVIDLTKEVPTYA